jgi:hypothetical protein
MEAAPELEPVNEGFAVLRNSHFRVFQDSAVQPIQSKKASTDCQLSDIYVVSLFHGISS